MGNDGVAGAEAVVTGGGRVLAQDERSSVVWGMPGAIAKDGARGPDSTVSGDRRGDQQASGIGPKRGQSSGSGRGRGVALTVSIENFEYVRRLVLDRSGISLDDRQGYLVEARLAPLAKERGLDAIDDFIRKLRSNRLSPLHDRVVEAMTTNETSFFRDMHPFEMLKHQVLPDLIRKRRDTGSLSIWCGACSSGQEPYSIAILIREHFPELARNWKLDFWATDYSQEMLSKAKSGKYSQLEVNRGLPAHCLLKYFERKGIGWQIRDDIRNMVRFRSINLITDRPPMVNLDVVFLRNVLIYFKPDTKKAVLRRVGSALSPEGYLFLGGVETTLSAEVGLVRHIEGRSVVFRQKAAGRQDPTIARIAAR